MVVHTIIHNNLEDFAKTLVNTLILLEKIGKM